MNKDDLLNKVNAQEVLNRPMSEWKDILTNECNVFYVEGGYLAKAFDKINYVFCNKETAKDIVVDNLYALLRFKYFTQWSEEGDKRIDEIISYFTKNLKSTLKRISFNYECDCKRVEYLPDYCIAFRNGVYNFKDDNWFFKYDIVELNSINNKIYLYTNQYIITWYFDYDFEPLPIHVLSSTTEELIDMFKEITKEQKNYCFELCYNMCHDKYHKFSLDRFNHLCEIMGYTLLQSFSQHFIMLIGSGQNGKNSLFDGCFTNRLYPKPSSIDLNTIEEDDFITGSLLNHSHNLFLETDAMIIKKSKEIKQLTGSMFQTIHEKGVQKYSGIINCKYVFAGNDRENIKFVDNTNGFLRRINLYEIYYQWDKKGLYLRQGDKDYYNVSFSDDLRELKNDITNTTVFIYLGMLGIKNATKEFSKSFKFTYNEWTKHYEDLDFELKEKIEGISTSTLVSYMRQHTNDIGKEFFDIERIPFNKTGTTVYSLKEFLYGTTTIVDAFEEEIEVNNYDEYFKDNNIYISLKVIYELSNSSLRQIAFTKAIKKIYKLNDIDRIYANQPFLKCTFINNKLTIIN